MKTISLVAAAALSAHAASADVVTVQPGDTLSIIARQVYQDTLKWREICDANFDLLQGQCDRIQVGMQLTLPGTPTAPALPAAAKQKPQERPDTSQPALATAVEKADNKIDEKVVAKPEPETAAQPATSATPIWAWSDEKFTAPEGLGVVAADGLVTMVGHIERRGAGGRPGIWVRLPDAVEQAVSGQEVEVTVEFSQPPTAPVGVAYSTSEVGNSGWKKILGNGNTSASFTYTLKPLVEGKGDFIGILPNYIDTNQAVILSGLQVALVN